MNVKGTWLQAARISLEESKGLTDKMGTLPSGPARSKTLTPAQSAVYKKYFSITDARMRSEVGWTFEEYRNTRTPEEHKAEFMRMTIEILKPTNVN